MKYKLSVIKNFASAHYLREYEGKCEGLHGHNWKIRAAFSGSKLDSMGMLIDFANMKRHLDKVVTCLDHKLLNEVEPFNRVNPTAENIAAFIYEQMKQIETEAAKVYEVEVWESEFSSAVVNM
jgi:6-pyruvoyltetrahydropterin/6-carboxytetrahydropterin synthase